MLRTRELHILYHVRLTGSNGILVHFHAIKSHPKQRQIQDFLELGATLEGAPTFCWTILSQKLNKNEGILANSTSLDTPLQKNSPNMTHYMNRIKKKLLSARIFIGFKYDRQKLAPRLNFQ